MRQCLRDGLRDRYHLANRRWASLYDTLEGLRALVTILQRAAAAVVHRPRLGADRSFKKQVVRWRRVARTANE